ncbi:I78 family peptidase inhibitor [uncultured Stenotrophomonas sp.]|uniref:I78 family peptidase inhibitor n=1 Tax=uncultured Stenotrophomonas sp. TaxID=165438 RepID=UPI0028F07278|nr:I78 family peptidase inhibitor [uncultured Stenotrophomonas sp.]
MSSLSSRRALPSIGPKLLGAVLLPTVLLLGACKAPPMDEQDAAGAHAQKAAEEAAAPADAATGKATEAPPVGNCDANQVQSLIGQAFTDEMGGQAQQDASARELRVLKPTDMTTMEFVGERLNIEVDEKGVVSGVRCG